MRDEDKGRFVELLTDALAFYGQAPSAFALGVWWQACHGVELEQLARALSAHVMDPDRGAFAPRPADVVRVLHGTHADRSLVAWGKVFEAMRTIGAYRSVAFDDPAVHCAVDDMGGWPVLCRSQVDELPFLQKRFCDAHRAHSARRTPHPARLIGASEQENQGRKLGDEQLRWFESQTVLIGDPGAVRAVIASGGSSRGAVTLLADVLPSPSVERIGHAA